ncbi:uncharacterized protein LOC134467654 [Engraulis encrasicolus]|uniref:uncharacterized protein LOC134467654 n=1 Tax=Engraulis encrasicolus TaxID=184585 RepID=UPI002FCFE209
MDKEGNEEQEEEEEENEDLRDEEEEDEGDSDCGMKEEKKPDGGKGRASGKRKRKSSPKSKQFVDSSDEEVRSPKRKNLGRIVSSEEEEEVLEREMEVSEETPKKKTRRALFTSPKYMEDTAAKDSARAERLKALKEWRRDPPEGGVSSVTEAQEATRGL